VDDAKLYLSEKSGDCVIKFDGLAAGKGVFVCSSTDEANEALHIIS
jgi:phosphoribosylamine--glycine ligase